MKRTPRGRMHIGPRRLKKRCPVTKKIRWGSARDANMAIDNIAQNGSREGSEHCEKRSYLCPYCSYFHTTSQEFRDQVSA